MLKCSDIQAPSYSRRKYLIYRTPFCVTIYNIYKLYKQQVLVHSVYETTAFCENSLDIETVTL